MCLHALYVTPIKKKKIWVYSCHLTAETESRYENQSLTSQQIDKILAWIEDSQTNISPADSIIVCGDFNVAPESDVYKRMIDNGFKSAMFEHFGQEQITYPKKSWTYCDLVEKDLGQRTLDYVWYKGNITLENASLVGNEQNSSIQFVDEHGQQQTLCVSDHLAILANFVV